MSAEGGPRSTRILFVTLGSSPRSGPMEDIVTDLPEQVAVQEIGLLDGLNEARIAALYPSRDETSLVAYSGEREIVLSRQKATRLAFEAIAALPEDSYDLVVLMSTGILREFESSCPMVNGQRAVESAIVSVAARGDKVGLVVPLQRHITELDIPALALFSTKITYARPQDKDALRRAAELLSDCDYIVLNSLGYDNDDRRLMAELTQKPVLLPRRVILSSILLILSTVSRAPLPELPQGLQDRLADLTPRERQVMSLVCEGLSNKAVARQLSISHKTVEIHRSSILRKMQVPSSGALIRLVVGAGLT